MPLVQGPVTVSKVEALLEATTELSKKEVLGMVGRASLQASLHQRLYVLVDYSCPGPRSQFAAAEELGLLPHWCAGQPGYGNGSG
jgi:hypothetical protein